jgi:hypothetical protein
MRKVAGPFEQPLRPLLPHNDMLESNTPHTDIQDGIQDGIPFCGLYYGSPNGRDDL